MGARRYRYLAAACIPGLLVSTLTAARAQDPPAGTSQTPSGVPPAYTEILRAQAVLLDVLPRVFRENPDLDAQRVAYGRALEQAMTALDPETTRRKARLVELEAAYNAAVARNASPDVDAWLREGRELTRALRATAARARRQPALAKQADAFAAALRERLMSLDAIDPEIVRTIAASDRLLDFVSAAMLLGH